MNPQSSPVPSQPATKPPQGLSHMPPQAELIELGMLAIEDANQAELAAQSVPQPAATPPPVVAAAPSAPTPTPIGTAGIPASDVPAAAPSSVVTPTATNVQLTPSTGDVLAAAQPAPQGVPAVAPSTTPAKARDVAAPLPPDAPVDPTASAAPPATPSVPTAVGGLNTIDPSRMDLSANSMQMKGVARLRTLNMLLYLVLIVLIGGIIVGGWYLYEYLKSNSVA